MTQKILIAASGSGGHLLPALYIAKEIINLNKDAQVEFVGSGRPLEAKLIGGAGFNVHKITVVGFARRGVLGKLEFLAKVPFAIIDTYKLLSRLRPNVIIGVGGYISFFPILLGRMLGVKTHIHEAEKKPGMANKVLSFFASQASIADQETKFPGWVKKHFTGQPLNPELYDVTKVDKDTPKNILVMGGSQGADAVDDALMSLGSELKNFEIKHQCREENIDKLQSFYKELGVSAQVENYIDDMKAAYTWADLIISRSGLNTVREIVLVGRPAILIPLANAPEQKDNANDLKNMRIAEVYYHGLGQFKDTFEKVIKRYQDYLANVQKDSERKNSAREIAKLHF